MRDVYDIAKFFLKKKADSKPNTYDGNMKLQKLLTFANMANIAEYGVPLFDNDILAFKNGCVIEKVRLRYKGDYEAFKVDSEMFEPDFTEQEYYILNMIMGIFGSSSARELSEINHEFLSWKSAYKKGIQESGYHDKSQSVVDIKSFPQDIDKIKEIIRAYKESQNDVMAKEIINGVVFYYDNMKLTDDIVDQLEDFSMCATEDAYSIYMDNDRLVIY